jgi:hypothetical protein
VLQRGLILLVAGALTALMLIALAGHGPAAGQVILRVSASHGVNQGDLLPLAVWASGLTACAVLWRHIGS